MGIERIVVGVDGTEGAQRALGWCAELAAGMAARVLAIHVVSRTWLMELDALQVDSRNVADEARANFVGPWTQALRDAGVEYTIDVRTGEPATELLDAATKWKADVLVIGASRHGGLREGLLGGTAHRAVNHSRIPVVVVPPPAPDEPPHVPLPG